MCFIRAYLRASTIEQDASRARQQVKAFATDHGMQIAAWYVENESGATLARPELFRLLDDAHAGDVLLVEQIDRLSRLGTADWERLKAELAARKVRVVALDLPTSWTMATGRVDDFTARMFEAINGMMLDMLAAVGRKDYEDRRRRQMQGQAKAKAEGKYVGRSENKKRNAKISAMLKAGASYSARREDQPGRKRSRLHEVRSVRTGLPHNSKPRPVSRRRGLRHPAVIRACLSRRAGQPAQHRPAPASLDAPS